MAFPGPQPNPTMPSLADRIIARVAYVHALHVSRRFRRSLERIEHAQQQALRRALAVVAGSEYARRYGLDRVRSPDDLRAAAPLVRFDDIRPYVQRVAEGDPAALLNPRVRLHMFALTSGTTSEPKMIPVTGPFVRDYRRGWNVFGLKMLRDHPAAILRPILQSTGRIDERTTPAGIPAGAITGLLAATQKRIVRRYYVGDERIARLEDPVQRYYCLVRFGIVRDVAFAVTANPATLIRIAEVASEHAETLIRDVHDGTLSAQVVTDGAIRRELQANLRPEPARARELETLLAAHGVLRPRDYWKLEFLACWIGGSLAHYRPMLERWYGPLPVRDIGLLASEGRVTIPLEDDTPVGVLDVQAACFEFIPLDELDTPQPRTLGPAQLEAGGDYVVVLTNTAGLVRYVLDDVVRMHGWRGRSPRLEFRYRAGHVSSLTGEKLTEDQVVAAARQVMAELGLTRLDVLLAPAWDERPFYRLYAAGCDDPTLGRRFDAALCEQNEEYASRRKSRRLAELAVVRVPHELFERLDAQRLAARRTRAEQYKRPCLLTQVGQDETIASLIQAPASL